MDFKISQLLSALNIFNNTEDIKKLHIYQLHTRRQRDRERNTRKEESDRRTEKPKEKLVMKLGDTKEKNKNIQLQEYEEPIKGEAIDSTAPYTHPKK